MQDSPVFEVLARCGPANSFIAPDLENGESNGAAQAAEL